jgi:hypothetical protein
MYGMCKRQKYSIINRLVIEFENNWGAWKRCNANGILNFLNRIT